MSPIIGSILDRYIDPVTEGIFRPKQNRDQLSFTKNISYLMSSVQRGECQRWAIDRKMTCLGVSLDGESAFSSVDWDILLRELYSVGERADFHQYSRNTYLNTDCKIKSDDKLSRSITEHSGTRQGHVKASGHYKSYINPCLDALNSAQHILSECRGTADTCERLLPELLNLIALIEPNCSLRLLLKF